VTIISTLVFLCARCVEDDRSSCIVCGVSSIGVGMLSDAQTVLPEGVYSESCAARTLIATNCLTICRAATVPLQLILHHAIGANFRRKICTMSVQLCLPGPPLYRSPHINIGPLAVSSRLLTVAPRSFRRLLGTYFYEVGNRDEMVLLVGSSDMRYTQAVSNHGTTWMT
jgi:hypothetical protein